MLVNIKRHIVHQPLDRISSLAVPKMLEIGSEPVDGESSNDVFEEAMATETLGCQIQL